MPVHAMYNRALRGKVAEWSNAPDSKSGLRFCRNVGSNPTLSASTSRKANVGAGCQRIIALLPTSKPTHQMDEVGKRP